jgi:putative serine protease PepD
MKRASRLIPVIAGAIAGGVIALIVAGGSNNTSTHTVTSTSTVISRQAPAEPAALSKGQGLTINQIYRNASPGVVDITVTTTSQSLLGSQQSTGEGAGVVYDTKGDILTDEHVVAGASTATVKFQDGKTATAKVIGTDPSTDVGVIRVNVPASELHPIAFADSNGAQVGDPVVAIGSPFSLPETVTQGIVSQTGRPIQAPNQFTITGAIQTDAAINPGNSGGPLLDADAHVLGLNDQIQTNSGSSAGVGFAIPSNTVARIAGQIIGGHTPAHPYVGIHLNQNSAGGAQIGQPSSSDPTPVAPGAPAAAAGLKPGDLITAVNGRPITSTEQFITAVDQYSPKQVITLTIKRNGAVKQVKLTLGTRPTSTANTGG